MISLDGDVLKVGGEMRLAEAARLRDAGLALIKSAKSIDLSGVGSVDSSALAVLIAWERASGGMDGGPLPVVGAPEGLRSLAHLYEVGSYCGLDADSSAR
ncbi:MAG: STAS domain-containing protein [Methyloversatilis sp.]|jgi:phospholipid transport system transporter-binding protein|nr:STAS domain-containing protein [Methyloversatilis sp.]MBP6194268.1 STAS domain-containing protein [Methyloversatilis sp.]MBP9118775.1 STAS domain-containing protein [Methyloversatilis sp.]